MSHVPTYLIVTVMCKDDDTPERSLIETADDILAAGIKGVVSVRAAHNDHPLSLFVPIGPEYFG